MGEGVEEEGTVKNNSEVLSLCDNTKNSNRKSKVAVGGQKRGILLWALKIQDGKGLSVIRINDFYDLIFLILMWVTFFK